MSYKTVLVADDDEDFAGLLRCAFEEAQFSAHVLYVGDGQQVIDYLSGDPPGWDQPSHIPDLLLLDINMPKVDGFGVLGWVKSHPQVSELPVVVLSASASDRDRDQALGLGAKDYEVKPNDFEKLVNLARTLDARWFSSG